MHWFSGYPHPRSVVANGGIYQWRDGRRNWDTLTAVFDYGPADDMSKGFQVVYSSRQTNSAGGIKELYYSNAGMLNMDTQQVTPEGSLKEKQADEMHMKANLLSQLLAGAVEGAETSANTGAASRAFARTWSRLFTGKSFNASLTYCGRSVVSFMLSAGRRTSFTPAS